MDDAQTEFGAGPSGDAEASAGPIVRAWLAAIAPLIPGENPELFGPGGALETCGHAALRLVTASLEMQNLDSLQADGPELHALAEALSSKRVPPGEGQPGAPSLLARAAIPWGTLSLPRADAFRALQALSTLIESDFRERCVACSQIDQAQVAIAALGAASAELRTVMLEGVIAADREEAIVTQHLAGRFLANASHELRTPLTAVLGFSELLMEETYGPVTAEQRTAIGHIEASAHNLLEIVNNLLDLLQIRAGKLQVHPRPVDIKPLLEYICSILAPLARRKDVDFSCDLPELLGMFNVDEKIVRHIVYHLLASALRSTPSRGEVRLSAERAGGSLVLIASDTALHLPPEALANMAGPFPLLENSPVRGYEGWEIGLPLVRRYVELHGGTLTTESQVDSGTIFRIELLESAPTCGGQTSTGTSRPSAADS